MANIKNESEFAQYAASVEGDGMLNSIEMPAETVKPTVGSAEGVAALKAEAAKKKAELDEISVADAHEKREAEIRQAARDKGAGFAQIPTDQLPSKGLFYPEGMRIFIKTATIGDIKRWSSMNEEDIRDVNNKIQDILESCCTISMPADAYMRGNFKDLIDIDRLYILFAIHDYTFPKEDNPIRVKINENDNIILRKESVKFIDFSDKLMNYYNPKKRCFSFPVKNTKAFADTEGKMDIYVTNIGVGNWLMDYADAAEQRHDNYDRDFVSTAALLIKDWRGLNVDKYYKLIEKTQDWGVYEWSLISKVKDVLGNATQTPTMSYMDGGVEHEVPLFFRDGLKSMFLTNVDIDL